MEQPPHDLYRSRTFRYIKCLTFPMQSHFV